MPAETLKRSADCPWPVRWVDSHNDLCGELREMLFMEPPKVVLPTAQINNPL